MYRAFRTYITFHRPCDGSLNRCFNSTFKTFHKTIVGVPNGIVNPLHEILQLPLNNGGRVEGWGWCVLLPCRQIWQAEAFTVAPGSKGVGIDQRETSRTSTAGRCQCPSADGSIDCAPRHPGKLCRLGQVQQFGHALPACPGGVVNLLPVDRINEHEGARRPGASVLCGGGKARDVLPGVESLPQLLTVFGGGEKMTSQAEVLRDGTIRGEEALRMPR